jgi:hypothetical protein
MRAPVQAPAKSCSVRENFFGPTLPCVTVARIVGAISSGVNQSICAWIRKSLKKFLGAIAKRKKTQQAAPL